ncbi:hypothetical protein ACH5RR_023721 [Cinchona calisaya]|uniref:Acetyl-CoA carboxylase carboxyltransferase beta subunit n=1 Tax=Cinchona calisaya TaxID=153742 RepID=A0ABD2ZCY3_9GENT
MKGRKKFFRSKNVTSIEIRNEKSVNRDEVKRSMIKDNEKIPQNLNFNEVDNSGHQSNFDNNCQELIELSIIAEKIKEHPNGAAGMDIDVMGPNLNS